MAQINITVDRRQADEIRSKAHRLGMKISEFVIQATARYEPEGDTVTAQIEDLDRRLTAIEEMASGRTY